MCISKVYERYRKLEVDNPGSIVMVQIGDNLEIIGKNANEISNRLGLALRVQQIGEVDVCTCGFPLMLTEPYIENIIEEKSVIVMLNDTDIKIEARQGA